MLLATYILYWTVRLVKNILRANATCLPVRWTPVTSTNPFWIVLGKPTLRVFRAIFPSFFSNWTYFSIFDWHWVDRLYFDFKIHEKNGDIFLHITPLELMLHTRDPQVAKQIFYTCPKPDNVAKSLELCGPNMVSSNEVDWPNYCKITIFTFNNRNNRLVWSETVRQILNVLQNYQVGHGEIIDPEGDIRRIYLNMFFAMCFGRPLNAKKEPGETTDGKLPGGYKKNYRYCLETSLRDIFILQTVPNWIKYLPPILVPHKISKFFATSREIIQYLDEIIRRYQDKAQEGGEKSKSGNNLLRITVRNWLQSNVKKPQGRNYLSKEKMRGNLLIYSLVGHKSNAHTLTYTLYFLAACPNIQDWLAEELAAISLLDGQLNAKEIYFGIMAKFPKTLAVMVIAIF